MWRVVEQIGKLAKKEGKTVKYQILVLQGRKCPICGTEIAWVEYGRENPDGTGSQTGYIGCPKCGKTERNLNIIKQCNDLEKEIRQLGITTITTYEPPCPSGDGEVYRYYRFTSDGVEFEKVVDGKSYGVKQYPTLANLFLDWYNPFEEMANLAKYVYHKKTGKKARSQVEKLFGPSISQPVYD